MTILDVKAILYFADLGLIEEKTILIRDSVRARSFLQNLVANNGATEEFKICLLYTSDAADE